MTKTPASLRSKPLADLVRNHWPISTEYAVKYGNDHFADIFVYDTLSGGAGYATLAGEIFLEVIEQVETLLHKCDCSSSCDKCLRHYGNRIHHGALNRFLALDLLTFIKDGRAPESFDRIHQQRELESLAQMLLLAGWDISQIAKRRLR